MAMMLAHIIGVFYVLDMMHMMDRAQVPPVHTGLCRVGQKSKHRENAKQRK